MRRGPIDRRLFVAGVLLFAPFAAPHAGLAQQAATTAPLAPAANFQEFLQRLQPLAESKGVRRETLARVFYGLEPDPGAPTVSSRQPEFDKPYKNYLADAVSARRIAQGQAMLRRYGAELGRIEKTYGVPREIVLAAYGIETDYGRVKGGKDIIRTLATLAFTRPDRPLFVDELIDALIILDRGEVPREKLRGSWAGAMGGPQFLPSAYLKYAVSYDGSGFADIWDNPRDVFASIANFLRGSGWTPRLSWGFEVILPQNFSFPFLRKSFGDFAQHGVVAANGKALPAKGEATLFLPSGSKGPAFLLSDNYWVLKAYNNSDAYALSLGHLADRIGGAPGLRGRFPESEPMLSRAEKAEMQRLLARLRHYQGTIDGRFGQASRDAIHAFQKSIAAHPADGYGSADVLRRLREHVANARP
jgi:membrane-bound lytic murein transglycosylase B